MLSEFLRDYSMKMSYKQICLSGKCVARCTMFNCSPSTTRGASLLLPKLCGKFREKQYIDRPADIQGSSCSFGFTALLT